MTLFKIHHHTVLMTLFFVLLTVSTGAAFASNLCASAAKFLVPNTTVRATTTVDAHCFDLDVAEPGVATLDAIVPTAGAMAPRIFLACEGGKAADEPLVLDRRADHLALAFFEPGPRRVCVTAQDPRKHLRDLRLRAAFAVFEDDGPATKEEDEGEIEIEPGHILAPSLPSFDPADLCAAAGDDHGDTFLCATPARLGAMAKGELSNGWGDDRDVFTFAVGEQRTVEIRLSGTEPRASLLNAVGDHLTGGKRLVKTLAPGRYFVLVEGAAAAAPYVLRITAIDTMTR